MKTRADLHREIARAYDMIEGTSLSIKDVTKIRGSRNFGGWPLFEGSPDDYEFALAIVEGRPVFKGDELYFGSVKQIIDGTTLFGYADGNTWWSWNPPKPKTLMVELLVDDAEHWVKYWHGHNNNAERLVNACRKALGELK